MHTQHIPIPNWAVSDRPREKMITKGRKTLSDSELLAILIGTGSGLKSAVDLGREIMAMVNNNLNELGKLTVKQLCAVKGIGESKAISILAALELGRRKKEEIVVKRKKIKSAQDCYHELLPYFSDLQHEEFYIMLLNRANEIIGIRQVSIGGSIGTIVDPKIVFKIAIDFGACGMILSHNHPSGNLKPSDADISLTKRLRVLGNLMDIPVLDHLIISDNGYFSFLDNEILA